MEFNRDLKRMNIGDVLDYSVQLFKCNFKKIALVTLILDLPFIFIYNLLSTGMVKELAGSSVNNYDLYGDPTRLIAYYLMLMAALVFYGVYAITIKPVVDAVVTKIVYFDVVHKEKLNLKNTMKDCFKKFPSLFTSKLLYSLIIAGVCVGLYIVLFIILFAAMLAIMPWGIGLSFFDSEGTIVTIVSILLILLIVLALSTGFMLIFCYFVGKYRMNIPAIVIENNGAAEAIGRCGVLAKKQFKYVTFTYGFAYLLFLSVTAILPIANQAVLEMYSTIFLVTNIAIQILQSFIAPFLTVVSTMMFIDLKIKNESLDLELLTDQLLEMQQKEAEVL